MKNWLSILALACILALQIVHASIKVYSPSDLKQNFESRQIRQSIASFGRVPYGSLLAGRVYYFPSNSSFCTRDVQEILDKEGDPDEDFSPIVLVDRGSCSFIRKTRNVQEIGGALCLIADNRVGANPTEITMVDDGTGVSVAIPTIMISKEDGELIKQAIKRTEASNKRTDVPKEYTVLLVDFEGGKQDDRIEYNLWYTSGDGRALEFIKQMSGYVKRLGKSAVIVPHLIVRHCRHCNGPDANCNRYGDKIYCAPAIKGLKLRGSDSLRQGLEELCIYNAYKDVDNAEKWWDYMLASYDCKDKTEEAYRSCIASAKDSAGIDSDKLRDCSLRDAATLEREFDLWLSSGIPYNPAVVINNKVYRGSLDAHSVFKSVCSEFNTTPDGCYDDYDANNGSRTEKGGLSGTKIFGIIILVVLINVLLIYCYRRYTRTEMKEEMQLQVSSMMSQYFALSDNKDKRMVVDQAKQSRMLKTHNTSI